MEGHSHHTNRLDGLQGGSNLCWTMLHRQRPRHSSTGESHIESVTAWTGILSAFVCGLPCSMFLLAFMSHLWCPCGHGKCRRYECRRYECRCVIRTFVQCLHRCTTMLHRTWDSSSRFCFFSPASCDLLKAFWSSLSFCVAFHNAASCMAWMSRSRRPDRSRQSPTLSVIPPLRPIARSWFPYPPLPPHNGKHTCTLSSNKPFALARQSEPTSGCVPVTM